MHEDREEVFLSFRGRKNRVAVRVIVGMKGQPCSLDQAPTAKLGG